MLKEEITVRNLIAVCVIAILLGATFVPVVNGHINGMSIGSTKNNNAQGFIGLRNLEPVLIQQYNEGVIEKETVAKLNIIHLILLSQHLKIGNIGKAQTIKGVGDEIPPNYSLRENQPPNFNFTDYSTGFYVLALHPLIIGSAITAVNSGGYYYMKVWNKYMETGILHLIFIILLMRNWVVPLYLNNQELSGFLVNLVCWVDTDNYYAESAKYLYFSLTRFTGIKISFPFSPFITCMFGYAEVANFSGFGNVEHKL